MGPRFKVSSKRQLIIVRLISPGIEATTSGLQVERSNHRALRAGNMSCSSKMTCITCKKVAVEKMTIINTFGSVLKIDRCIGNMLADRS